MGGWQLRRTFEEIVVAAFSRTSKLYSKVLVGVGCTLARSYRVEANRPAHRHDTWYRPINDPKWIRDGRIHHSAFGGKAITDRNSDPHVGNAEVSGRLFSQTGTVAALIATAEKRVRELKQKPGVSSKLKFAGVARVRVDDARRREILRSEVLYDPTPVDNAHSDVILLERNSLEFQSLEMKRMLADSFVAVSVENLAAIPVDMAEGWIRRIFQAGP